MREKILITAKKLMLACLAILAVVGLGMTRVSALSKDDKAELKITNIEGKPKVTLYQIGEGKYSDRGDSFIGFEFFDGAKELSQTEPTSEQINKIANGLNEGGTVVKKIVETQNLDGNIYVSKKVSAGIYIAILTGAEHGRVYNPILLTASYNGDGMIKAGKVSATDHYLYGDTAVAKSSQPTITKKITKSTKDGDKDTASLGEKINYKLTVQLPSYSKEATNKTVFVSDTMSAGLTFIGSSLRIKWNNKTLSVTDNKIEADGKTIADVKIEGNSFYLNFDYDNLEGKSPEVSYSALLNERAIVGKNGNDNIVEYYYSNNPNKGTTHKGTEKPQEGEGVSKKTDKKVVYTYRVAFKKIGKGNISLAGAVFGIYSDNDAKQLVDIVVTNENGYGASNQVGQGTYYIKEIKAPLGYSLNTNVYKVSTSWEKATTTSEVSWSEIKYTTNDSEKAIGTTTVGWLLNNIFYKENPGDGGQFAYINKVTEDKSTTTKVEKNQGAGAGTVLLETEIPNTKLGELPSTGSIGTYLFKAIGSAAMIGAIGIYIVKRRKA
ncbi:TPA: isopeptide-forming domain-containing fimbrial protein [Streptococcus pyogenes]|uniref:isopeptide-forming domain-containing fimbrial protein n=1 Tax=Streptococcus pyogenes TaxID=1314 RepID=UPI000513479C|nr:isopeptide-forming domain-containing fimbrial protein [Streptococcus pyogenes]KGE61244.1 LPXTG-motif cell wall anchor domain protein [Streptococcus pyogenes MGAS2111]SQG72399.1 T-antigen-like fimbrial structural subunit protein FszC [Streptococcus pyogenes]VGT29726.1 T-antigen-like fimbrial structural subunit protein FszC [Streptococcus pyogenes]VGU53824.1 T-antigen-like fimbrial structural subunit protein FszC [Streptococcus pyogenes]VGU73504.1 T-antigen-like fimbrial structural subunit pr